MLKKLLKINTIIFIAGLILMLTSFALQTAFGLNTGTRGYFGSEQGTYVGKHNEVCGNLALTSVKDIDINVVGVDIAVVLGDDLYVQCDIPDSVSFDDFEMQDDRLVISQFTPELKTFMNGRMATGGTADFFRRAFLSTGGGDIMQDGTITITIPSTVELEHINVNTIAGDVTVSEVNADEIYVNGVDSEVFLQDVNAEHGEARTVSGRVEAHNSKLEYIDAGSVSGSIDLSGVMRHISASVASGDITVEAAGVKEIDLRSMDGDLSYTGNPVRFTTTTFDGHVTHNGKKIDSDKPINRHESASGTLDTMSGDIVINDEERYQIEDDKAAGKSEKSDKKDDSGKSEKSDKKDDSGKSDKSDKKDDSGKSDEDREDR